MDSPEAVVAFDPDGQVLGQGVADFGVEIERGGRRRRSRHLEIQIQVRGHRPATEPSAHDALQLPVPRVLVQCMGDAADLEVQAPEPGLAVGLGRDELDPPLDPIGGEMAVTVQGGQGQVEAEFYGLAQAVGPLRRQPIAVHP